MQTHAAKASYTISVTYEGNMWSTLEKVEDDLPPAARITSGWSKKENTLTATITDIELEDLLILKLKFNIKTNQLQTANSQ
jgi:hypothetical protein